MLAMAESSRMPSVRLSLPIEKAARMAAPAGREDGIDAEVDAEPYPTEGGVRDTATDEDDASYDDICPHDTADDSGKEGRSKGVLEELIGEDTRHGVEVGALGT